MDISNILIEDSNGDLAKDLFKIYVDNKAVSVWFDEQDRKRVLNLSPNNIRFDSIPNIHGSTYKTFLSYNGTLGLNDKVFSTVVAEDSGIFNVNTAPTLTYNADAIMQPAKEDLDEAVLEIKMYNGTVDVLTYTEGALVKGEKTYSAKTIRAYPTVITSLPNISGDLIFIDGWYSYTFIIFRDLQLGGSVSKDMFYGIEGFIFKASDDGYIYKNTESGNIYILKEGDSLVSDGVLQIENTDYEELLFSLNASSGSSAQAHNIYLHSQVLITEEIRDKITSEIIDASERDDSGCDFADWQKLMMKRLAAVIMFQNELYENAQIIMESARNYCKTLTRKNC